MTQLAHEGPCRAGITAYRWAWGGGQIAARMETALMQLEPSRASELCARTVTSSHTAVLLYGLVTCTRLPTRIQVSIAHQHIALAHLCTYTYSLI